MLQHCCCSRPRRRSRVNMEAQTDTLSLASRLSTSYTRGYPETDQRADMDIWIQCQYRVLTSCCRYIRIYSKLIGVR
jgi:hypothetical protein